MVVPTTVPAFLESAIHDYFGPGRVCKLDSTGKKEAGGTEYFLVEQARLLDGIAKVQELLLWIHEAE